VSAAAHDEVFVRACAKLNLALRVGPRRPDGFHDLDTIFQTIDLHDDLIVSTTSAETPLRIACDAPAVPADDRNLAWRAAQALWSALGRAGPARGVAITLTKRIPVRAGLGGGSADAAAALKALSLLWGYPSDTAALQPLAAAIGADAPFFLHGGTARGRGRGDLITSEPDWPPMWTALVVPPFGVATADAYQWLDEDRAGRHGGSAPPDDDQQSILLNDLEGPVARRYPRILGIRDALTRQGATAALMTGSGSTVFGAFGHAEDAHAAADALTRDGWRVIVARTLGAAEHAAFTAPGPRRRSRPV
jgi:4-diphosphocytidyl-2-C-methyl-D-erythritol kinase